jgi:hypothetical protein
LGVSGIPGIRTKRQEEERRVDVARASEKVEGLKCEGAADYSRKRSWRKRAKGAVKVAGPRHGPRNLNHLKEIEKRRGI